MLLKTTAHLSWENFYLRKFCFFIISLTLVSIHVYAQSGAWKLIDSLPTPRVAMMQACLVNGKIYFIGGTDDASTLTGLATNEVYNPLADTWKKKQPMPTSRCFLTTVVVNGTIYAIGGNWPSIKTVEAYDPVTDSWTKKADMLSPRNEMQAGVVNGIIYVMSGSGETRNCMAYNPITNQWIEKSKRPEVGGPVAVAVYNNLVYTFGGTFGPQGPVFSTVYAYDPQTDTWVKKKDMPTPRFAFQTLLCKGKIYAMGGTQGGTAGYGTSLSNVEVYDPATDT